jgi:hypothetical protein
MIACHRGPGCLFSRFFLCYLNGSRCGRCGRFLRCGRIRRERSDHHRRVGGSRRRSIPTFSVLGLLLLTGLLVGLLLLVAVTLEAGRLLDAGDSGGDTIEQCAPLSI